MMYVGETATVTFGANYGFEPYSRLALAIGFSQTTDPVNARVIAAAILPTLQTDLLAADAVNQLGSISGQLSPAILASPVGSTIYGLAADGTQTPWWGLAVAMSLSQETANPIAILPVVAQQLTTTQALIDLSEVILQLTAAELGSPQGRLVIGFMGKSCG